MARQRHHGDQGLHALIIDLAPTTVHGSVEPANQLSRLPDLITSAVAIKMLDGTQSINGRG